MIKKIISILLVINWMIVIFCFSSDSGETSSGLSDEIVNKGYVLVNKNPTESDLDNYSFIVRKCAHFTEYFILGIFVINALYTFNCINKITVISAIICIMYALSDEFHQTFISGRDGNICDAMLDSSASMIASYVFARIKIFKS